jgi:hypothetical protein
MKTFPPTPSRLCRWRLLAETGFIAMLAIAWTTLEAPAQSTVVPYAFTNIAGQLEIDFQGGYADGTNSLAQFFGPEGLAVDGSGNVYVADKNNDVIRKITHVGTNWVVTTLAGQAGVANYGDAIVGTNALFNAPRAVAVDPAGNVFVADTGNNAIREITPAGSVSTIAGDPTAMIGGFDNGPGLGGATFDFPTGIAVDASEHVYVADYNNNAIRILTRAGAPNTWNVGTLAGNTNGDFGDINGTGSGASFNGPWGIAVDRGGNVYVADSENNEIRICTPAGAVSTLAGFSYTYQTEIDYYNGKAFPNKDGTGTSASFFFPYGVAVDTSSNVYVADTYNNEIRKISPAGVVTTIGGQAAFVPNTDPPQPQGGSANGTGAAATFNDPVGIVVDLQGNVYVGDTDNDLIRQGQPPVVQVVALEVTQVIQDWSNSIPLIQGKDTYVRAHLQLTNADAPPITISGAMLYYAGPDGVYSQSTTPINPGAMLTVSGANAKNAGVRENFSDSLNFRLPPAWTTGAGSLQLAWAGGLQATNGVSNNCAVNVTFSPAPIPQIKFFDVQWTSTNGTLHQLGPNISVLADRVLSCFPAASVNASYGVLPVPGLQPTNFGTSKSSLTYVNELLAVQRSKDLEFDSSAFYQVYHGGIATLPSTIGSAGRTSPGSLTSASDVQGTYGPTRTSAAHELAHNVGIYHDVSAALFGSTPPPFAFALGANPPPGSAETGPLNYAYPGFQPFLGFPNGAPTLGPMEEGDNALIYGFDSLTWRQAPPSQPPVLAPLQSGVGDLNYYFDLMSYCRSGGPEERWPSSWTYATILRSNATLWGSFTNSGQVQTAPRSLAKTSGTFGPRPPQPNGGTISAYLLVRGLVDFAAGTAQFLPCLPVSTNSTAAEPPGTNFMIVALNGSGGVLQTVEFALQPAIIEDDDTDETADFIIPINANPALHELELYYNGVLMASLTAGPAAPIISLTTPNGGQNYADGSAINASWSASDPGGEPLFYTVQYSPDDGTTWQTLAVDWTNQTLAIPGSQLFPTQQGLLRVIASDGIYTTTVQSASTFTVQPHAPAITIYQPQDGSVHISDEQLFLDAAAYDVQDGALGGAHLQWHSDRDGALGSGSVINFDTKGLTEGYHTLTVAASNGDGLTNSAVTHIWVLYNPPPQLGFQITPGNPSFHTAAYGTLSWPSYYTNYVLQAASSLTLNKWNTLSNNPPQVTGNQYTVNVGVSNMTSFFRLVMLP